LVIAYISWQIRVNDFFRIANPATKWLDRPTLQYNVDALKLARSVANDRFILALVWDDAISKSSRIHDPLKSAMI
jgi:hypothetical protein